MNVLWKIIRAPFKYWYVSAFLVGTAIILKMQLGWWIEKNGWVWNGTLVNHFGEPYQGTVLDWLARTASPFAIPVVIFVFLVTSLAFGIPWLIWTQTRKSR